MIGNECFSLDSGKSGVQIYARTQFRAGGTFHIGLYFDTQRVQLSPETSYTYSDYTEGNGLNIGRKDQTDDNTFHSLAYKYRQET